MANKKTANVRRKSAKSSEAQRGWEFPLERKNLLWLGIGLGVIIIGFLLMSTGISEDPALTTGAKWNNPLAITVAPILLVIGYCGIIPFAIMKNFNKNDEESAKS